ncbi:hypothetical protein B0A53_02371 [Rhodotorula sp. CCFEE 5036]|nr:hypothetical protein B0A53_02371 [Rhodotorula sp. CCFEE 5036]
MLRPSMQRLRATAPARRRIPPPARNVHTQPTSSSPPPPRPPPPKYIRFATVYPFILLSIITSLALNLSVQRTARETEGARHRAQISVLEKLVARLRSRHRSELTEAEQDEIERELELVGLGRGRGKEAVSAEMSVKTDEATSWKEVFLGKKGKGYEPEDDKTDWEAVFKQADEAEQTQQRRPPPVPTLPSPPASPAPPPTQAAPASPVAAPRPNPSKPVFL